MTRRRRPRRNVIPAIRAARRHTRPCSHGAALGWLLLLVFASMGSSGGPPTPAAQDSQRLVLPDALPAESEVQVVDRLIERGEWDRAVPALQRLLEERSPQMAWDGASYGSLAEIARKRLTALPPAGLRAYRLLYGPVAEAVAREGIARRDLAMLLQVAKRYPACAGSVEAATSAAAILMDEGRFAEALRLVRRTRGSPAAAGNASALAMRELVCLARLGRGPEAAEGAAQLDADATLNPPANADQPTWAAVVAGLEIVETPPRGSMPDLEALEPFTVPLNWPRGLDPQWPSIPSTHPVAGSGCIFVSRDGGVVALDTATWETRWSVGPEGLAAELAIGVYEGQPSEEDIVAPNLPVGNIHHWRTYDNHGLATLTHADGRLYGLRFDPLWLSLTYTPWEATQEEVSLTNALCCFDARDGRVLWRVGGGRHGAEPLLRDAWYFTAPCVSDGRAYVLAAYKGELYAICLDALTGTLVWNTPVGGIASRVEVERYAMELFLTDCCPPVTVDGVVIFPTGHGLVWACAQTDGQPLWALPYDRTDTWVNRLGRRINVPSGPWVPTRPAATAALCVLTPLDSRKVIALIPATGEQVWESEFVDGQAMLGILDGRVFVQHGGLSGLDVTDGQVLWTRQSFLEPEGIGVLEDGVVLMPYFAGILALSATDGSRLALARSPYGSGQVGNVIATAEAIVSCAPRRFLVLAEGNAPSDLDAAAGPGEALASALAPRTASAALALYLNAGDEPVPGPLGGEQSAWTVLAREVETACEGSAELRSAWHAAFEEQIDRAADAGNERRLALLAERAVLPDDREQALQLLRPEAERSHPPTGPAAGSIAALPSLRAAAAVGARIPYDPLAAPPDGMPVLAVHDGRLRCIRTDGVAWTARLPYRETEGRFSGASRTQATPFYRATQHGLVVVLADLAFMVQPDSGDLLWSRPLKPPRQRPRVPGARPRFRAIQWLRRGRPADATSRPPPKPSRLRVRVGREWLVRWADDAPAQAIRLRDGKELRLGPAGTQADLAGRYLCVFDGTRNLLTTFTTPGERWTAAWRLPAPNGSWELRATEEGLIVLNDVGKVLVVEAATLRPVSRWRTKVGIREVLFASGEAIVVALGDGSTCAYPAESPADAVFMPTGTGYRPTWAHAAGGVVLWVEAESDVPVLRDPRAPISGSAFAVRSAELGTGRFLWEERVPEDTKRVTVAPRRGGRLYELRFTGPDGTETLSVDARSGRHRGAGSPDSLRGEPEAQ